MRTYEQYLDMVNDTIARLALPETPARLYQPITYTMTQGGKRLRPVLTLMATDAMGGDSALALQAAAGVEMFHNFTLLHDDVMDRAAVRRGQPTVHRKWNDNVAILSGDAMLTLATGLVAQVPGACLAEVLHTFNRTAMEIYEGQQHDMDFESRNDVTVEQYMHMIRLKTSVLLGCACRIGALIAGAPDDACQALYDVAVNTGLAFQLRDDLLDAYGDTQTFGKQTGTDIKDNKKTYLLLKALQTAEPAQRQQLIQLFSTTPDDPQPKIEQVLQIYNQIKIKEQTEKQIAQYHEAAIGYLDSVNLPHESKQPLFELTQKLLNRNI